MKKYLFVYGLLVSMGIGLQSCLFSEENIFQESSANRATTDVVKCSEILKNAPNGWKLEYYAGANYSLGGFTFLLKFDGKNVEVACESGYVNYTPGDKVTSLYQVKSEQSTMLTFDSYNPLLHLFSSPLGMNSNLGGDYEFIVLSASTEKITLQGKKYKNIMEMTPMPEDEPWLIHLKNIIKVEESAFMDTYHMQKGGKTIKVIRRNPGTLSTFDVYRAKTTESSQESLVYIYTTEGIKLRIPYIVEGISVQNFKWDPTSRRFICTDEGATDITLNEFYPEGYMQYNDFVGEYILGFSSLITGEGFSEVTITPLVNGESYKLTGLPLTYFQRSFADIILKYNKASGQIVLDSQDLGLDPQFNLYFAIAAGVEGYKYAHPELAIVPRLRSGLTSVISNEDPLGFYLSDKATQTNSGFIVWTYSSANYSESTMGGIVEYFQYLMLRKKTDTDQ